MPQRNKNSNEPTADVDAKPDPGTTAGGAAAGGATGAAIGAVAGGPVGAAVGGAIGSVAGAATGASVDYDEDYFRRDYEGGAYRDSYSWEQAGPAYRYGWESYGTHGGSSYDQVSSGLKKGWAQSGKYADYEPMVRRGWERRAQFALDSGGEAVVPIVEEEVKIGKRTVQKGGVKVESHVEERPVSETVHLHEETVKVERRPANRAATQADVDLAEGTLELTETAEEAVVSKKARVVEEVVVRKQSHDKAETVHETARKTDVRVTETPGTGQVVSGTTTSKTVTFDDLDTDFRSSFKKQYGKAGHTYESYAPAYRFGYDLAGDKKYAGKDWSVVEADARRHWEKGEQGAWEDFKDAIQYAWDKVRGRR